MVPNVCPGKEYNRRRIFVSERELLLSEVVGKKDKMSNTSEARLDSVARPDSAARLDSPSDRRPRKGKVLSRKEKTSEIVLSFPRYTPLAPSGDTFFSYFGVCSTISLLTYTHLCLF